MIFFNRFFNNSSARLLVITKILSIKKANEILLKKKVNTCNLYKYVCLKHATFPINKKGDENNTSNLIEYNLKS